MMGRMGGRGGGRGGWPNNSVADSEHFDVDSEPDPTFHFSRSSFFQFDEIKFSYFSPS